MTARSGLRGREMAMNRRITGFERACIGHSGSKSRGLSLSGWGVLKTNFFHEQTHSTARKFNEFATILPDRPGFVSPRTAGLVGFWTVTVKCLAFKRGAPTPGARSVKNRFLNEQTHSKTRKFNDSGTILPEKPGFVSPRTAGLAHGAGFSRFACAVIIEQKAGSLPSDG